MFARIERLIGAGALVQATADFFLRERMATGMVALAEAGLIHVLSSDAHSSHGGRPVHLSTAFEILREIPALVDHVDWIAETAPRAIVSGGDDLEPPFTPSH
jgi:tyrosine-protein phosphatase YwqE